MDDSDAILLKSSSGSWLRLTTFSRRLSERQPALFPGSIVFS